MWWALRSGHLPTIFRMLPLIYPSRWRLAGALLLTAVLCGAMAPEIWPWLNKFGSGGPRFDKWLHGFTFAMLAIWYSGQYARHSYWWIASGLLSFGVLIEVCQSMVTYRSAELGDITADVVGIVAGFLIALIGVGGWSLRAEAWLTKRLGRSV